MLRFEECDRPSFTELGKLVLTSAGNTMESPSKGLLPKNIDSSKIGSLGSQAKIGYGDSEKKDTKVELDR